MYISHYEVSRHVVVVVAAAAVVSCLDASQTNDLNRLWQVNRLTNRLSFSLLQLACLSHA